MISTEVRVTQSKVKDNLLVFVPRVVLLIFCDPFTWKLITKVGTLIATRVYIILNIDFQVMVSKVKITLLILIQRIIYLLSYKLFMWPFLLYHFQTRQIRFSLASESEIWFLFVFGFLGFFFYSFMFFGGGGNS